MARNTDKEQTVLTDGDHAYITKLMDDLAAGSAHAQRVLGQSKDALDTSQHAVDTPGTLRLALAAVGRTTRDYASIWTLLNPYLFLQYIWHLLYIAVQVLIIVLFKPPPPRSPESPRQPYGRIAVIGAGLTGVSSAAHCIAHNFEVTIFEAQPREKGLGGIWAHVNSTSGLQINSIMYRFHPAVLWSRAYPHRDEILGEIARIWHEYRLEPRTRFSTPVTSVRRGPPRAHGTGAADDAARRADVGAGREGGGERNGGEEDDQGDGWPARHTWIINGDESTLYDAVIVNVGTCGAPKIPGWAKAWVSDVGGAGQDGENNDNSNNNNTNNGESDDSGESDTNGENDNNVSGANPGRRPRPLVLHSSALDTADARALAHKRIAIVGSGASGIEAAETVLAKAAAAHTPLAAPPALLARTDKWLIPRNVALDTALAAQPFGRELPLSALWERALARWHYGADLAWMVPEGGRGLYEGTPVVNDAFLGHVREGRVRYVQAATEGMDGEGRGVWVRRRGAAEAELVEADVVILATGFEKPSVGFFDEAEEIFPEGYQRPDLYLQNFSTEDWSVLMTNSAYMNAIGTVGHFHIGVYTRILLTLLLDPAARPLPRDMKLWVDCVRFVKRGARGGALGFFTYAELTVWLVLFHVFRPDRMRWIFFIMQGWGVHGPRGSY